MPSTTEYLLLLVLLVIAGLAVLWMVVRSAVRSGMRGSAAPVTPQHSFTRTQLREGYEIAEVDAFLRRARQALQARDLSVTASDVHGVRFTPTRLRGGYDMGEVDRELDRLAAALGDLERPSGP